MGRCKEFFFCRNVKKVEFLLVVVNFIATYLYPLGEVHRGVGQHKDGANRRQVAFQ